MLRRLRWELLDLLHWLCLGAARRLGSRLFRRSRRRADRAEIRTLCQQLGRPLVAGFLIEVRFDNVASDGRSEHPVLSAFPHGYDDNLGALPRSKTNEPGVIFRMSAL